MCGIWALLHATCSETDVNARLETLRARGPEAAAHLTECDPSFCLGFTRLAINGLNEEGMQPMSAGPLHWICNGELYNWKDIAAEHSLPTKSGSDCEVLGGLWATMDKDPTRFFRALDGVFSIVLVDKHAGVAVVGRDPFGVRPLFYGQTADGGWMFASEMKALKGVGAIQAFPPGCFTVVPLRSASAATLTFQRYYEVPWLKNPSYTPAAGAHALQQAQQALRDSLTAAVRKRLMTERPVAALLSGGIDSSLIAALVQRELKELGKPSLETFSIGFEGSPDLFFAQKVAEHIGSNHTTIVVTPDDFFAAIPEVIRAIESYDITTVRASVGNWMVSREIARRSQAKVVFNGDGSDEVFGSYLYFYRAPTDEAFEAESGRLLQDIHLYDVLRSDRSISSHGLEARTPFLDRQFVAVARSIATNWRRPVRGQRPVAPETPAMLDGATHRPEKWILRTAFEPTGLLPTEVLWRQKEAFSDGVSGQQKSWYQEVQERVAAATLAPEEAQRRWPHLTPRTAEAQYYRSLFDEAYGPMCESVFSYFWMPKWSGETQDPSARTLSLY
jgi:asparagine synthase (glutamine-hydrolysing)